MLFIAIILTACGVPQADYDKLLSENQAIKLELDELKNGEERLIAIIEKSYANKEYIETKASFNKLEKFHPQSDAIAKFTPLIIKKIKIYPDLSINL